MSRIRRCIPLAATILLATTTTTAAAQGRSQNRERGPDKPPKVSVETALTATRTILTEKGFEVIRVEQDGDLQIVHYRAGNRGRGRGHGPPQRLVIRKVQESVVILEAPDELKLSIEVKLGIRL